MLHRIPKEEESLSFSWHMVQTKVYRFYLMILSFFRLCEVNCTHVYVAVLSVGMNIFGQAFLLYVEVGAKSS